MPNYGTPIDPAQAPGGQPVQLRTVALGLTMGEESPHLPSGMASRMSNFIGQDDALVLRPGLKRLGPVSSVSSIGVQPGWVGEGSSSTGARTPVVISGAYPAKYNGTSWSTLSQLEPAGANYNLLHSLASDTRHFDAAQYYHPVSDEFELCFVNSACSGPYTWRPATALFSTLTLAPAGGLVCGFDNRLVFSNISSDGTRYPLRVHWSERGNPEVYTEPTGGFEELLDARGVISRLMPDGDRMLVFTTQEVWQGLKFAFPFDFTFVPLDRTVGCIAARSIAQTPKGIMFLGNDFNLYLIPPGGSPQAVGTGIQRLLRSDIRTAEWTSPETTRVYGYYDEVRALYLLMYDSAFGTEGFFGTAGGTRGIAVTMDGRFYPFGFDSTGGTNAWPKVTAIGETRLVDSTTTTRATQRVVVAAGSFSSVNAWRVYEWTSNATVDQAWSPTALAVDFVDKTITGVAWLPIGNPDPTQQLFLREVRMDYRSVSAASVDVTFSGNFGQTSTVTKSLGLSVATHSAQTLMHGLGSAVYPCIGLGQTSGHTYLAIQGLTAVVVPVGNG